MPASPMKAGHGSGLSIGISMVLALIGNGDGVDDDGANQDVDFYCLDL